MSYFISSPINISVHPHQLANATFHRVVANVHVDDQTYRQSIPVTREQENAVVEFDISSSLRAYAERFQPDVVTESKTYPDISFKVEFFDEYMRGGQQYQMDIDETFSATAMLGGYTERERLNPDIAPDRAETALSTLRPQSSAWLIPAGHKFLAFAQDEKGRTATMTHFNTPTFVDVPDDGRWFDFQFINTRGLNESAFARKASESAKGSAQTHVRSLRETFSRMSHRVSVPSAVNTVLQFSSGFVDLPTARWWAFEFCRSKWHWIFYNGVWMPCTVSISDNTKLYESSKAQLLSVEFDVTLGIDGPACL